MKILELRWKNLNSLYGEWVIDFTHPHYAANGIFALTGPTGAGKSTILDALCLALYGATPRLGKITKNSNEIMSRQTGECYAEVLFTTRAGIFRCHWEQRRARKHPQGKLQDQEHQIADARTNKLIEHKKSRVGRIIEEKTGMDFDRFTRSILLAQGGFDTFLQADSEQKSKILEQITGTEIYSDISRSVHERQRTEREKLHLLQAETAGIMLLEPQEEEKIAQELEAKQKEEERLAREFTRLSAAMTWLAAIRELHKEIRDLKEEAKKLHHAEKTFAPERHKLEQARKAASLDGIYATLTALRTQQAEDETALKKVRETLPALETSAAAQTQTLKTAEQHTRNVKEQRDKAAPLLQTIRSLDEKIQEQHQIFSQKAAHFQEETARLKAHKQARKTEEAKQSKAQARLETIQDYLTNHAQDERLVSSLTGIQEQLTSLIATQEDLSRKKTAYNEAKKATHNASTKEEETAQKCRQEKQNIQKAAKHLEQAQKILGRILGDTLLREYRAKKDGLLREKAYVKKIQELEEYRAGLEDGKPCPLCGAAEHPFARGNTPQPDTIEQEITSLDELISKAEKQEEVIKKLEQAYTLAQQQGTIQAKEHELAVHAKKTACAALEAAKTEFRQFQERFEALTKTVLKNLLPFGVEEIHEASIQPLLQSLQARLKAWQTKVQEKEKEEKQWTAITSEIQRLDAIILTQTTTLEGYEKDLKQQEKDLAALRTKRKNLYGDKQPDREEQRLQTGITQAEQAEQQAREEANKQEQQLATARASITSLMKRMAKRQPEHTAQEKAFLQALSKAGFSDEEHFRKARLPDTEQEALSLRAKELEHAVTELHVRQKDRDRRLKKETDRKLTQKTWAELEPHISQAEQTLKALRESIARLGHTLEKNETAKKECHKKQRAILAQQKECARFDKLHELIGSADGKKYRNFAQGLTFERMVFHANAQLKKMTDRYLLIRDNHRPLELNVIDTYQAGEIRSTKNLSGGESFIISLTLALGLSQMASRNVRVDSLFLDEGFGSLDEETLETALETLSGLHQDGKLIGVISHVSALKERISTQIHITPVASGKSAVNGPGCRNLKPL